MIWSDFLSTIENRNHERVVLVGPLHGQPFAPSEPTIYVDGGANFYERAGDAPYVRVGDGDSANGELDERLPTKKDISDLAFVLRALPANIRRIELHGFLGGRRDHEWANFGEIHKFLLGRAGFATARFFSASQAKPSVVALAEGSLNFRIEGVFSVMTIDPEFVKIRGACEYPLNGKTELAALSSHGLSNVGFGLVEITTAKPCFVFLANSEP